MRADLCRAVPSFRRIPQPRDTATGFGPAYTQMFVCLPILAAPSVGLDECPHSNLVPLCRSDLPQRARMAGTPTGLHGAGLPTPGQLFSLVGRLRPSAAADGPAASD